MEIGPKQLEQKIRDMLATIDACRDHLHNKYADPAARVDPVCQALCDDIAVAELAAKLAGCEC